MASGLKAILGYRIIRIREKSVDLIIRVRESVDLNQSNMLILIIDRRSGGGRAGILGMSARADPMPWRRKPGRSRAGIGALGAFRAEVLPAYRRCCSM